MSYIYQGETGWIKQPDQTASIFISGLCRIQQSYLIRKENFETNTFVVGDRLPAEDSPMCIDGAFIFPYPEYSDTGNGFMKCLISAYGRVNTTGTSFLSKRVNDYVSYITRIDPVEGSTETVITEEILITQKIFDAITDQFVVKRGQVAEISSEKLFIYDESGQKLPIGRIPRDLKEEQIIYLPSGEYTSVKIYKLGSRLDRYETSDYGVFQEVVITTVAAGDLNETRVKVPEEEIF